MGCDIFSRDSYTLPRPRNVQRDAGFVLVLPFNHRDLEPDGVGVSTRGGGDGWELSVERKAERCYQC